MCSGVWIVWAVCLCADWCSACRAWRPVMAELAARHPELQWRWLDVEDEAELMDSVGIDIETFPTMLLCREDRALFMGAIPPQAEALLLLMDRLGGSGASPAGIGGPAAALAAHLWGRHGGPEMSAV
ncbi:thioredoxin family protein [Hydrogenophaga taeniospiralis]|nr:thioredoxin family protein [Hydrogenophaga taeniospiralis]